jgi:hypothetical protein
MALTVTDYLAYASANSTPLTTSQVNANYLGFLLQNVDDNIQDELGTLFSLVQIDSTNTEVQFIQYQGHNMDVVTLGAWQKTDLIIKLGYYGLTNQTLQTLSEDVDYRLIRYQDRYTPGKPNPVVAVQILRNLGLNNIASPSLTYGASMYHGNLIPKLYNNQFLQVTGTYGWSSSYPSDLQNLLYQIIKVRLEWNTNMTKTGGSGLSQSESSLTLSRSSNFTPQIMNEIYALTKSIMADPEVRRIINKYKSYTFESIRIS